MTILVVDRYYMLMNLLFALTCLLLNLTHCFSPKKFNISAATTSDSDWSIAGSTWYGNPTGYGSDGGACGYGNAVAQPPFSKMVSAGGPSLFKSGKGCGACYQVKCTSKSACSKNPVTVVITDECPGCVKESVHFDLSGTAFGAMAISGQDSQLRNVGELQILYKKVECNYIGKTVTFQVDKGSNANSFAVLVAYVNGDGEIGRIELKQALDSDKWLSMSQSWGAVWKLDVSSPLRAPLSLRVTSLESGKTVVASNVIPANWQPGGACGFAVANPPLYGMVSAGGPSVFNNGIGCGTCFQILCNGHPACSRRPITVTITDECPGGPCASEPAHFDLSGKAMGALARPGQGDRLRSAGVLRVYYRRVECLYRRTNIAFRMDPGANPYYISFVVEYENGDGDLAYIEIQPADGEFIPMQEMRSAVWKISSGSPLTGPFNIRLTSAESHKVVLAYNVIPANWKPNETYRSVVNFK